VAKCDWLVDNAFARLDSEHQIKRYRRSIAQVRRAGARQLLECPLEIIHPHELKREFADEGGTWFLRTQNVRPMRIDKSNIVRLPDDVARTLTRNVIRAADILITRTGANRGDCALFDSNEFAVASSHTFIVRSKGWQHPYLMTFLNSSYGKAQIDKGVYGAAQPELAPYYLQRIWIPTASNALQQEVAKLISKASLAASSSEMALKECEVNLLHSIGLDGWSPPNVLSYVASASAVTSSGRLDAEHFSPAWLDLRSAVPKEIEFVSLGSRIAFNGRGIQPIYDEDGDLRVVASQNIRPEGIEHAALDRVRSEEIRPQALSSATIMRGDVLIYTTGAYVGRAAPYLSDLPALASNHVNILRMQGVDAIYASLVLNSVVGRLQTRIHSRGSAQAELYPRDIALFQLPLPGDATVEELREQYEQAQALRSESEHLLSTAKRAVEIAIEDNEEAALTYITQVMEAIDAAST
jgi:hypothetical protein